MMKVGIFFFSICITINAFSMSVNERRAQEATNQLSDIILDAAFSRKRCDAGSLQKALNDGANPKAYVNGIPLIQYILTTPMPREAMTVMIQHGARLNSKNAVGTTGFQIIDQISKREERQEKIRRVHKTLSEPASERYNEEATKQLSEIILDAAFSCKQCDAGSLQKALNDGANPEAQVNGIPLIQYIIRTPNRREAMKVMIQQYEVSLNSQNAVGKTGFQIKKQMHKRRRDARRKLLKQVQNTDY